MEIKKSDFKTSLREGQILFGSFAKITDPAIVEIMGIAGFDFVIIDQEHGPISLENTQNMIRAAENSKIKSIIRVAKNDEALILRALDIGAYGIEVPQINSRSDAVIAVNSAKYFPQGKRGLCKYVRAAGYSSVDKYTYFNTANKETAIILHIEGLEGINNIDEILSVSGIDVIFIGPYDLSQSLNIPGDIDNPLVAEKMKKVVLKCKEKKVAVGTFADDVKTAKYWASIGAQYIAYSVDVGIFYNASRDIINKLKN